MLPRQSAAPLRVSAHEPLAKRRGAMPKHAPLRVLMVGRGVVPIKVGCGGAELAMYQLGKTLAGIGHQVTVVADIAESDFPAIPGLTFVPPTGRLQRLA